ncbi:hypothetical protein A9Q99_24705 [Gammaproteobacteria bacterium 45_16_T64]|nr:hypothetical protein A9Q99_24705 [Gammaproteobacteria bacterium 45_16_T64]
MLSMLFMMSVFSVVLAEPDEEDTFYIIVNKNNSIETITIGQLSRVFTKKTKKFDNGVAALPIAQRASRSVTQLFNLRVLKKNAKQLKYYWSRKMFSGSSKPPKALSSDMEVEKFVASLQNAIGYVSQLPTSTQVKVLTVEP